LVGPALAGVLIAALGASNVLYVDAATFGVATIAVGLFVPRTKPMAEAEERGLLAGVRYILRSRLLVMLCVSTLTMEVFFTLFLTTLPVFAYSYYDQNARIAGVFYAAMGAGALLGMPVVPVVVRRFGALQVAAAVGYLVGSAPFAIYVARNRSLGDPVALASDAELPEASSSV